MPGTTSPQVRLLPHSGSAIFWKLTACPLESLATLFSRRSCIAVSVLVAGVAQAEQVSSPQIYYASIEHPQLALELQHQS